MKYNIAYLFAILFTLYGTVISQNIRFTVSGRPCVFPVKHNGIEYSNCIVNEKGQEWCYIDHLGIAWDFCSRGEFKIESTLLIKNMQFQEGGYTLTRYKKEFCIFEHKDTNRIYSIDCEFLLEIKKHSLDKIFGIDVNSFEFFWINGSQIKTKEEKCLHPVETPIIINNKISYFGYVEVKKCLINDDLTITNEQKWKLDENGRIVNFHQKKCLVRVSEGIKLDTIFTKKRIKIEYDKEYELHAVNLGDCIGNSKGYQGREIWLLEEFHTEELELMALSKLMGVYKQETSSMEAITSQYNSKLLKLIDYNSMLIDYKQKIDDTETKLEEAGSSIDNFDVDKKITTGIPNKNLNEFNLNGLLMQVFELTGNENLETLVSQKPSKRLIIAKPFIYHSEVGYFQIHNLFNHNYAVDPDYYSNENIPRFNLNHKSEKNSLILISGYLVSKATSSGKFKVETNCSFTLIFDNKILMQQYFTLSSQENADGVFNSPEIKIPQLSLNHIQIVLITVPNNQNLKFSLSFFNSETKQIHSFTHMDFIPLQPFSKMCYHKSELLENIESLTCDRKYMSIDALAINSKVFLCDHACKNQDGICLDAYRKGRVNSNGGLMYLKTNKIISSLNPEKFDFGFLGIDSMITDVKLGYVEDFKKYSRDANNKIFKNYIVQLDLNDNNPDNSFLFYKKELVSIHNPSEYVLIDAKLMCDNNSQNQTQRKLLPDVDVKIEKVHDMINGFTVWLHKIRYEDYLKLNNQKYVEELKILILPEEKAYDVKEYYETMTNNKFMCPSSNKKILLEVSYKNEEYVTNTVDFHADISTSLNELVKFAHESSINKLKVKCDIDRDVLFEGSHGNVNYKDKICVHAFDNKVIPSLGGMFMLTINYNSKGEPILLFDILNGIPCLEVLSENSYKAIYASDPSEINKHISQFINDQTVKQHQYSSFVETEADVNKFYSKDFLLKIEEGLNQITEKIIEGSKKMSEVSKINQEMGKKLEKIQTGENSIEVVTRRVNEILKLETNLEQRLNKKFAKYHKMITEKDNKIHELSHDINTGKPTPGSLFYNLQLQYKEFFNDFFIVDSLDSKNGPSNWDIKEQSLINTEKKKISLIQSSAIYSVQSIIASSLILKSHLPSFGIKINFSFFSPANGSIIINFKYKNFQNFTGLSLSHLGNEKGEIKLIERKDEKINILNELSCEKMMTIFGKCVGYSTEKVNDIEILMFNQSKVDVIMNKYLIFSIMNKNTHQDEDVRFSISINNIPNIEISTLEIKYLSYLDSKVKYEGKDLVTSNKVINGQIKEQEMQSASLVKNLKRELTYNPAKNTFEVITAQDTTKQSQVQRENLSSVFTKNYIKDKCLKYEKEDYVCNYISNVITKHQIHIETTSTEQIVNLIRDNCNLTMKSSVVCKQILKKLEPIINQLKYAIESPIKSLAERDHLLESKKSQVIVRDIKKLITACSFEFLPKLLQSRKICLNDIMIKEIQAKKMNLEDECVKEFCINCCFINYGNTSCNICKKENN